MSTISLKKRWSNQIKKGTEAIVLSVLYGGLFELYKRDSRIQKEIDSWKHGMTYCLQCQKNGPSLYIRKNSRGLERLDPGVQTAFDTCFQFKSIDSAFLVLTGQLGISGAYAAHGFTMKGDIGTAMSFARSVDLVEAYLFPGFISGKILKEIPEKEMSAVVLYLRIFAGLITGRYQMTREKKLTYTARTANGPRHV